MLIQVQAHMLPQYIGYQVADHGELLEAAVVRPGDDIVIVRFGEGFARWEKTFRPDESVFVELD